MDSTLHDLGNLFIESIPTVILFIIMTVYLKLTFFKPIGKILDERRSQTEGVRELANKAFDAAQGKEAEFERALQEARNKMYAEHESMRDQWEQEQQAALAKARAENDAQLAEAKRDIAAQMQGAEQELNAQVDGLSEEIAASVLRRRAA